MLILKSISIQLYLFLEQISTKLIIKHKNSTSNISWKVYFRIDELSNFKIGDNSSIGFNTRIYVEDFNKKAKVKSKLIIGSNTYIGEFNNIRAGGGSILIGNNCSISQFVSLIASNHGTSKKDLIKNQNWTESNNNIQIEDDVWIGCNTVVLPGVKISKGSIIGAGSIVTKNTEPYSINVGNPARLIKFRQ